MKKGKLIVIEGSDGSGKSTQLALLEQTLKEKGYPVQTYKFPDYESFFGKMIASYLRGEYGDLNAINPYLISVIYAQDRAQSKSKIEQWLQDGYIVLLDRYVISNLAHQSGRLPKSKREDFVQWDLEFEYTLNNIPHEDIVLYLHVPYQISIQLMEAEDRIGRHYANGQKKDIVESNKEYLKNAEVTYTWLTKQFSYCETIECVDAKGNLRSVEEIHSEIKKVLAKKGIVQ